MSLELTALLCVVFFVIGAAVRPLLMAAVVGFPVMYAAARVAQRRPERERNK